MGGPYREPGVATRVRATRCLACGGRCNGETCAFCGVESPDDAAPRANELRADCPRCFVALELSRFSEWDAGFVYCVGCHGCFVPPIDWAVMLDRIGPFGRVPGDELMPVPEDQGLRPAALADGVSCPVCRRKMDRVKLARADSLPIDICIMHGIWFDASELAAALRSVEQEHDALVTPPEVAGRAPAEGGASGGQSTLASARTRTSPPELAPSPERRGALAAVLGRLWELVSE